MSQPAIRVSFVKDRNTSAKRACTVQVVSGGITEIFAVFRNRVFRASNSAVILVLFENGLWLDEGDYEDADLSDVWKDGMVVWGELASKKRNNEKGAVAARTAPKHDVKKDVSFTVDRSVPEPVIPVIPSALVAASPFPPFPPGWNILAQCRREMQSANKGGADFIESNQGDFVAFDYESYKRDDFANPILRELRGLLVDRDSGMILCRRFHKFRNLGEEHAAKEIGLASYDAPLPAGSIFLEKQDGKLCSPIVFPGDPKIRWASKRQIDSAIEGSVSPHMEALLDEFIRKWHSNGYTLLFESLFVRDNRSKLVLLAARHNLSGLYCAYQPLYKSAAYFGIEITTPLPELTERVRRGEKLTVGQAAFEISKMTGIEGAVLFIPVAPESSDHYAHLVKMKTHWYLFKELHSANKGKAATTTSELDKLIRDERQFLPYSTMGRFPLVSALKTALASEATLDDTISDLRRRAGNAEDLAKFESILASLELEKTQPRIATRHDIKAIFIDLDGVLADFERGLANIAASKKESSNTKAMWSAIERSPGFFAKLPCMEGQERLWEFLNQASRELSIELYILSSLPFGPLGERSAAEKREWCAANLNPPIGADRIITCATQDKALYGDPGSILIDDRPETYERDWNATGGLFLHHSSSDETIRKLKDILRRIDGNFALERGIQCPKLDHLLQKNHARVVILRGLPGSGKSTVSSSLMSRGPGNSAIVVSADHYFTKDDGTYEFDMEKLKDAHADCFDRFCRAVESDQYQMVIVDNTNSTLKEIRRYSNFAVKRRIKFIVVEIVPTVRGDELMTPIEVMLAAVNVHRVNVQIIAKMKHRWESVPEDTCDVVILAREEAL